MAAKRGIPEEILQFFRGTGGHSLIVKGPAGTGKTTFALQLTEDLDSVGSSFYLSTRVSDHSLYNQFPWLGGHVPGGEGPELQVESVKSLVGDVEGEEEEEEPGKAGSGVQIAGQVTRGDIPHGKVDRTELRKLEGRIEMGEESEENMFDRVGEGEVIEDSLIFDLGSDLPEVDMAYDAVERILPDQALVLIDSIDALAERYGIHPSKLINTIQRDLVETTGTNVLYVLETGMEHKLDYLGDGVVTLKAQERNGRRLRIMTIEKLRGTEIRRHKYIFTLQDGRIQTFRPRRRKAPKEPKPWQPVEDPSPQAVSTGNEELDALIGGISRGAMVALEVGERVPGRFVDGIMTGLIANFAAQGRGVAFVPERRASSEIVGEEVSPYLGPKAFQKFVRIYESYPLGSLEGSTNALQLEGTSAGTDLKWSNVMYHLTDAEHPFLSLMGFDTLEAVYGEDVVERLSSHMYAVRRNRDIFIGVVTPTTVSSSKLADLAHTHLCIENIDGSVVIYAEKPYSELHALDFDYSQGFPKARLTPII